MPLTPADVHNIAFGNPRLGARGHDVGEVNAFLDLIETELAALIEENAELRNQSNTLERRCTITHNDLTQVRALASRTLQRRRHSSSAEETSQAAPVAAVTNTAVSVQAARMLGLAQEMADRLATEAKIEADTTLNKARAKSEQLLSDSLAKADALVNEARTRAELMVEDARARAETMEREIKDKAVTLTKDAERKHADMTSQTQLEKSILDKKVDELRTFEKQYRTRLHVLITSAYASINET